MLRSVRDLLHVRWRTAQLIRALVESDGRQARVVRQAMRVEGIDSEDMIDEFRLLLRQFGYRTPVHLSEEISRLWHKLALFCTRCGQSSRHRDCDGVCVNCVLREVAP